MLQAVLFDLDDTLYDQALWLNGAWAAVAAAAEAQGADYDEMLQALRRIASEGSDRGHIINRAAAVVLPHLSVDLLVQAFKGFRSPPLPCFSGAERLQSLRRHAKIAIVTDGDPTLQMDKVRATGVGEHVDAVVCSDELGGRAFRKPSPLPFLYALERLGLLADEASGCVMVGDRPGKDIDGASALGMRTIRVRTGEYRDTDNCALPTWDVESLDQAMDVLMAEAAPVWS